MRSNRHSSGTRILLLNRSFWPDFEATGQFFGELCEDLSVGHEICVIAGPSYHAASRRRFPWARERKDKVSIIRTWGTKLPKSSLALRLVNLGSYYVLAAAAALLQPRPDVLIAATDPPLLGALGALLKRRWKCHFVYNVRDLYPDIARVTGGVKSRALLGLLERASRLAYDEADMVVVLGADMAERVARKGVDPEKVRIVPDWVDCDALKPQGGNSFRAQIGNGMVAMYSGNLGMSQQLEAVLDAAALLRDEPEILFALVGEGARKRWLEERARALRLDNVRFFPYQPRERLGESLAAADIHLVPLLQGAAGCIVPSKIYGILGAGRPFIAMMEEHSEVAQIATTSGVGFVVAPGDSRGLANTLRAAASDRPRLLAMGARARALAESRYDRKIVTGTFARALATLGPSQADDYPAAPRAES